MTAVWRLQWRRNCFESLATQACFSAGQASCSCCIVAAAMKQKKNKQDRQTTEKNLWMGVMKRGGGNHPVMLSNVFCLLSALPNSEAPRSTSSTNRMIFCKTTSDVEPLGGHTQEHASLLARETFFISCLLNSGPFAKINKTNTPCLQRICRFLLFKSI